MSEPTQTEASSGGGSKKIVMAIVLVLGTLVGGGAGAFVAGPLLAEKVVASGAPASEEGHGDEADAEHAEGAGEESHAEEKEPKEGGAVPGVSYLLENLVLNPAESGGTRFLMLSVSFDLKDAAVAEEMKARDAEVRDAVLTVLGRKTVDQLASVSVRDSLKLELRGAVGGLFPKGAVRKIYLPQFVIQ